MDLIVCRKRCDSDFVIWGRQGIISLCQGITSLCKCAFWKFDADFTVSVIVSLYCLSGITSSRVRLLKAWRFKWCYCFSVTLRQYVYRYKALPLFDAIIISSVRSASDTFKMQILKRWPKWCIIYVSTWFLVHRVRYNDILLFAGKNVITISSLRSA